MEQKWRKRTEIANKTNKIMPLDTKLIYTYIHVTSGSSRGPNYPNWSNSDFHLYIIANQNPVV